MTAVVKRAKTDEVLLLEEAAQACRILHRNGHADMTLGHLSVRDPAGRGLWLKRSGIGLGEVRGPDDFILLDFDGKRLAGSGGCHREWPIHAEIMRRRPDVGAVGHSHPFHACLFAATMEPLRAVSHEAAYLTGGTARYDGPSTLVECPATGRALAEALGSAAAVFMRNHGVTFVGRSIAETALIGVFVEKACRAQLMLAGSGLAWRSAEGEELAAKTAQLTTPDLMNGFWAFYQRDLQQAEERWEH